MERGEDDRSYRRLAAAVIVGAVQDYTEARLRYDGGSGSSRIVSEVDQKSAERFLTVHNDGDRAVRLAYVTTALRGCIGRVPRLTIEPGARGENPVTVTADANTTGRQDGTLAVHTDSKTQGVLKVKVRFQVREKQDTTLLKRLGLAHAV